MPRAQISLPRCKATSSSPSCTGHGARAGRCKNCSRPQGGRSSDVARMRRASPWTRPPPRPSRRVPACQHRAPVCCARVTSSTLSHRSSSSPATMARASTSSSATIVLRSTKPWPPRSPGANSCWPRSSSLVARSRSAGSTAVRCRSSRSSPPRGSTTMKPSTSARTRATCWTRSCRRGWPSARRRRPSRSAEPWAAGTSRESTS